MDGGREPFTADDFNGILIHYLRSVNCQNNLFQLKLRFAAWTADGSTSSKSYDRVA